MAMRLYVGNLPYTVNSDSLKDLFSPFGEVTVSNVIMDKMSGRSKGFGFIEFVDDAFAKEAIAQMNGKEIDGRALRVNEAKPMEEGTRPSGGGFGGGNRRPGGFGGGGFGGGRSGGGFRPRN
jgi:RNA recognition motif-containing protein